MKDYARIATKIQSSIWLITPEGLTVVLDIAGKRMSGEGPSDEFLEQYELVSQIRRERSMEDSPYNSYDAKVINGVGILPIAGPIFGKANMMTQLSGATSLEMMQQDLNSMVADDAIHSIILDMDTPGGTSDLVAEMGDSIYQGRQQKDIYAIANSQCGSAGLWLASQATKLYSTTSGSVGSLGAYTVHEDKSVADAQQGRKFTYTYAGAHKVEGNPHEPLSNEAQQYRQEVIDELYGNFVGAVARGRGKSAEEIEATYGGGRMLTARAAHEAGVIDEIMPYDSLVSQLTSRHSRPQLVTANFDGVQATAMLFDGIAYTEGIMRDGTETLLESKEWEHSEPGTGSPPQPRRDQDGSTNKDILTGSRRDPLPLDKSNPNAPQPSPAPPNSNVSVTLNGAMLLNATGGENVDDNTLETELAQLLGIEATAVMTTVTAMHNELSSLRQAVATSSEEMRLKEQFPAMWAEHQQMLDEQRDTRANAFVDRIKYVGRAEGDKILPTAKGMSALAMETVSETHKKFAMGQGTLEDFEHSVSTIMNAGIVDYSEQGSSREAASYVLDTSTAQGVQNARTLFGAKIAEIRNENKELSYEEATVEAAKRYPDIASAYRVAARV